MAPRPSVAVRGDSHSSERSVTRVVIVDEAPAFRRAARELLERRGYAVAAEADSAKAAIAAVERFAPDAVLLDVDLRDANGFDVCARLTHERPDLAVLLVSAYDDDCFPFVGASGARGFVPKSELASVELDRFWA